ncbi:MAG: septum formation initiator family protein [Elusimicrobia bacterium]|nr:septum formation initiator family protein [Elusimicrobiota bacterium]
MTRRQLAFGGAVVLAAVMFGNRGFRRLVQRGVQLRRMRHEVDSLKTEETSLRKQLRQVQSNDRALESSARRELGFIKPGEIEYRFPPPAKKQ